VRLLRLKIYTPAVAELTLQVNQHGDLQYDASFAGMLEDDGNAVNDSALDDERTGDEWITKSAPRRIAPSPTSSTWERS
jgi:hypothetical protein